MNPYYDQGGVTILNGDCVETMAGMEPASVDAIVTDPPYGLAFMGKKWDAPGSLVERPADRTVKFDRIGGNHNPTSSADAARSRGAQNRRSQAWHEAWAAQALRVLKPGGHLLAFGGTRTYHRLTCAVEDAGFEIRDCLAWMYGSGFPKSLDVSKAIDKAERGVPQGGADPTSANHGKFKGGCSDDNPGGRGFGAGPGQFMAEAGDVARREVTDAAKEWDGWGTALKPAFEPVVMARKPLAGTVAANVQEHGTGALNVDGCRVETDDDLNGGAYAKDGADRHDGAESWRYKRDGGAGEYEQPKGRWPANVVLDEEAAAMLDEQSGEVSYNAPATWRSGGVGGYHGVGLHVPGDVRSGFGDSGGASRFFYTAKASRAERNGETGGANNIHPTVKPIDLMRWLVRLVTPPGGVVLDPFLGSGTTAVAARDEGFRCIGVEREAEYCAIAAKRLAQGVLDFGGGA